MDFAFSTIIGNKNIMAMKKQKRIRMDTSMSSQKQQYMTRLAMSNEEMANDMITMNAENIQNCILKLYKSIGDLTNSNYFEQITEIKSNRQKMFL